MLTYILSFSFELFSQAVAPSDNCFLRKPEEFQGFRQTNHEC